MPSKLFLLATFIFLIYGLNAQSENKFSYNYKVVYNLKYAFDSTQKDKVNTSQQVLLIGNNFSIFAENKSLYNDTVFYNYYKIPENVRPKEAYGKLESFRYHIIKKEDSIITYDFATTYISNIPLYKYGENKNEFLWSILPDMDTIENLRCQKAICNFSGRQWIAWFSTSIPISDGPYKFCGLPGLIVKLNDTQNSWNFSMLSFTEENNSFPLDALFSSKGTCKNYITTSKKDFLALRKKTMDNLEGILFAKYPNVSPILKERYKKWAKNAKEENNWIELNNQEE